MINIRFIKQQGLLEGFEMKGHSGYAEHGSDIVCAAVSSAAYMTANCVTEIIGIPAEISVDDGYMMMKLTSHDAMKAQDILRGFELHINELSQQYQINIKVNYSEV
ncbi:MAG: ribosomal-processing cysteine protease Prp [Ruminococcus sp.]|nr:ribosomal-processing cysteine protease Prp [Ruminococcus sp.]